MRKTKDIIKYLKKPLEEVTIEELRDYLYKYLLNERKLSDRTVNYYNSIIRFVYEVTLDKLLNKKQIPMRKQKKNVYKVLTKEELSTFFHVCDDFKFKTIFMLVYGSGLRIGEVVNLRVEDIDSKTMRIFVREGKGNKERYTMLPQNSLEMLRIYWSKYRQNRRSRMLFLNAKGEAITQYVIRTHFRKYREKAKLNKKVTVHTLRHCFATNLIENGATLIQVKELMGHSNIRSTMEYVHVANIDLGLESPLDVFLKGEENGKNSRTIK
jgi:site-specific recombinase XerD